MRWRGWTAPPQRTASGEGVTAYFGRGYDRDRPPRPRRHRGAPCHARAGALHGPFVGAWRGAPAVRHGGPRLSRLRQRHRRHRPGPCPSARDGGDPPAGRPADGARPRDGLRGADREAGGGAVGHVPAAARHRLLPELGLGGDRRVAEARTPRDRTAGDDRVPRRVPRSDVGRDERDHLEHQLPHRLRADGARRLLRAVPLHLRPRRRRAGRDRRRPGVLRSMFTTVSRRRR